jgi:hypothetical protein
MNARKLCCACTVVMIAAVPGCSDKNPAQPTGTGSVTAPRQPQPATNATLRYVDQPITLTVANATVTEQTGTTYTFEVATDTGFVNKVQTRSDVAEGTGGRTSVRLDTLAGGSDYFWHVRATSAGTVGLFGPTYRFTVGPQVVLNAPVPVSPTQGALTDARPTFTVTNAPRSGPAGPITYRFEISAVSSFAPLTLEGTVPEGNLRTTFRPNVDLPVEATLFWRVTAIDAANGVVSPVSATATFVTALAIDLRKAQFLNSPDVSNWPVTGTLTLVEQDGGGEGLMCMAFTDPGWPDSPFFGDPTFGVFANQWYFAKINGIWYGGAGEWLYRGLGSCKAGQGTRTIGPDSGFGPPFSTWVPRLGELVGFMVTSVARPGVRRTVDQRTNIIVQGWRDTSLGSALTPNRR